jgi:hypothetical protein
MARPCIEPLRGGDLDIAHPAIGRARVELIAGAVVAFFGDRISDRVAAIATDRRGIAFISGRFRGMSVRRGGARCVASSCFQTARAASRRYLATSSAGSLIRPSAAVESALWWSARIDVGVLGLDDCVRRVGLTSDGGERQSTAKDQDALLDASMAAL